MYCVKEHVLLVFRRCERYASSGYVNQLPFQGLILCLIELQGHYLSALPQNISTFLSSTCIYSKVKKIFDTYLFEVSCCQSLPNVLLQKSTSMHSPGDMRSM